MSGSDGLAGLSTEQLRAEVRAVLRDVLPVSLPTPLPAPVGQQAAPADEGLRPQAVTLRTDADLDVFVRRLAELCEDPAERAAIRSGRRRFVVAVDNGTAVVGGRSEHDVARNEAVRVERGAVTERRVQQIAAAGGWLVMGPKAVLTPLARDRARALGVRVEREH